MNSIPTVTKNLLIINVLCFFGGVVAMKYGIDLNDLLGLHFFMASDFNPAQLITYMFMHGSFMHIFFNLMTLYSFGPVLEQVLGDKKYVLLYFVSGLGAFFLFNLWNFVEVEQIKSSLQSLGFDLAGYMDGERVSFKGNSAAILEQQNLVNQLQSIISVPMVGASGAIFGVIAAFATLYPDAKIMLMFIPVPVKVKYLMPVVIIVSIYLGISGNAGGIAHLAHVGGALVGFILAKIWKKHLYRFN